MTYRYLPHTADVRVALHAPALDGILEDAVAVIRDLLVGTSSVEPRESRTLCVESAEPASLLFEVLRELVFLYDTERFVPAELYRPGTAFDRGRIVVRGELLDPARHEAQPEVKAVTRHGLTLECRDGGWYGEVVFDL